MVDRRWPMVKSLAMLGELYSTMTLRPLARREPKGWSPGAWRMAPSTAAARVSGASLRFR